MRNDLVIPGDKYGEKKTWKFCDVERGLPAAPGPGRGMPGALTPQDKVAMVLGSLAIVGACQQGLGLQCPGGRSVLEGNQTQQSGPRQVSHSPVLRAAPSSKPRFLEGLGPLALTGATLEPAPPCLPWFLLRPALGVPAGQGPLVWSPREPARRGPQGGQKKPAGEGPRRAGEAGRATVVARWAR